jgi:MtrB/PioB family decaheme-associated outer membrane protein
MKKLWTIAALLLLLPAAALAQEEGRVETSGQVTAGVQQVDLDPNSSKFNEYRDIEDGFYLYDLRFEGIDTESGRYLELKGTNLIRDDQYIRFRLGDYGSWGLEVERNEIPHRLSNKAKTPYIDQGDGLLTVPSPVLDAAIVGIPNNSANTADMLANDQATADWLATHLRKTDLGTQRDKTSATLQVSPLEDLKFRLTYSDERKDGSKITYGPIGNRPPNSLNIQFAEPIDYQTRELKFEAEYNRDRFQSLFTYLLSDFDNDIEDLTWQNIWAFDPENPLGYTQASSAGGSQRLATFGRRALAPDNRYHNATLSFGIDLPLASRLAATASYGKMDQDEDLLPYSTTDFGSAVTAFSSTSVLPRTKADAEIETKLFNLDYTINPIDRLNLRAFYRYYDLDNNTDEDNWRYVTSDALPDADATSGNSTFKNQRTNLAYAYDQQNYGLDAIYNLALWRTTLGLGYEREEIDRDFREADTDENMFKASVRTRPADWISLRAKYLYGDREGDDYNTFVTAQSYWYDPTSTTNADNPAASFTNHPDMRKFDVIDRERNQFDIAATVMPLETLDLTASYNWREDDFDDGVNPTQPLANSVGPALSVEGQTRFTPGDQLGLLERETERYALDASYMASDRLTLNAFGSRETIESKQRGLEYNENNKLNPEARDGLELGPWDRATSQWVARTDDETNTVGAGVGFEIVPGKLNFMTDYVFSRGKVDIDYSGFGAVSALDPTQALPDNHEFAFRDPSTVRHNQYTLNATLEYQVVRNLVFGLHYLFDRFSIDDWMQEADQPWFESVGSEFLLRDSSDSHQWGNRLVNMGSTLGPSYESHVGYLTMTYKF